MALAVCFRFGEKEYYKELGNGEEVSFGCHKKDEIQIPDSKEHMLWLRAASDEIQAKAVEPLQLPSSVLECNEMIGLNQEMGALLYISRVTEKNRKCVDLPYNGQITVGRAKDNDIVVTYPIISGHHFQLILESGKVHVEDLGSTNGLYLNGKKITKALMKSGDVLSVMTFRFALKNGVLFFENIGSSLSISKRIDKLDKPAEAEARMPEAKKQRGKAASGQTESSLYPVYQLSPRIREQLPYEPIVLSSAPGKGPALSGHRNNFAYLISSGAMMAASLATGMITPSALIMRAAGMISPIANMAMYGKMSKEEKKQLEEYEQMRKELYQAYVDAQKARISKVADVQRRILTAENPAPLACIDTVNLLKRNLWERMATDSDFLTLRLGIGKDKLCVEVKSRTDTDGFSMVDDELEELAGQIIEETKDVDMVPIRVPMKEHQTIGIVGRKEATYYLLRNLLVELTTAHSGKDVHLVGIFERESRKYWKEIRWLPHIWDESGQVRYIAFDEERVHTVCELLSDIIRRRKAQGYREDSKKNVQPHPHYVIVAESQELLMDEGIYEDLVSNRPELGITTIILAENMYDLPQTCKYIVDLTERPYAFERDKYDERLYFKQDDPIHSDQLEQFCRRMAAIELKDRGVETTLPSSVTFLQGYGVSRVEELDILKRWENSQPYSTLAAPIGWLAGRKPLSLNVLEGDQAHGPHGLLAGTTGSGKSELLQTWILSMAVTYHPHDVNFVIIDYKGGGMSDLLEPLPHVVGKITNIDRNITRSLISLKSELKRRQRLFSECEVNNITKYQKAYKNGLAKTPLPHLIIVTDEFAELKKEEPEFMKELNSVATIGRTLGVHMLLATQKPAGVVTDQISANARFRICMKVQDVADSREMLKCPDAAKITQAGRAYIRVGEDELFELFQSFYSAAEYRDGKIAEQAATENKVRIVGVTGNRINSVPKRKKKVSEQDELTAVIHYINRVCREQSIAKMDGPWLPELPRWLPLDQLVSGGFDGEKWPERRKDLKIPIGRYDIPALQSQGILYMDLMATGHFGIYGMPATGKTFLLKTILMAAGMNYTPEEVQVTVLDAGNWSMKEFAEMPHVREVILNQEEERLKQFARRIHTEIEARKKAFLKYAVNSLAAYREAAAPDTPAIVVMVDQIKPLFEKYPLLDEILHEIVTSGAAYGIYLIFTANSGMALSYNFTQLIKGAITFQQPEKGNYAELAGQIGEVSLPQFPGRALMRGQPPVAFQAAVYAEAQKDQERHEQVLERIGQMKIAWDALQLEKLSGGEVKEEPEATNTGEFWQKKGQLTGQTAAYDRRTDLPVGIYTDDLEPAVLNLEKNYTCLICNGEKENGKALLDKLEKILRQKAENQLLHLKQDNYKETLAEIMKNLKEREKHRSAHKQEADFDENEWIKGYMQLCILIEDLPALAAQMEANELKQLRGVFTRAEGLGVIILAMGKAEALFAQAQNAVIKPAMQARHIIITEGNPLEYTMFACKNTSVYADTITEDEEGALIQNGTLRFIRYF